MRMEYQTVGCNKLTEHDISMTIDEMYNKTLKAQSNAMKDILSLENNLSSSNVTKVPLDELMKKKGNG